MDVLNNSKSTVQFAVLELCYPIWITPTGQLDLGYPYKSPPFRYPLMQFMGGGGGKACWVQSLNCRLAPVRLRFGDGTVRAVPVFGSGGSFKEGVCAFQHHLT